MNYYILDVESGNVCGYANRSFILPAYSLFGNDKLLVKCRSRSSHNTIITTKEDRNYNVVDKKIGKANDIDLIIKLMYQITNPKGITISQNKEYSEIPAFTIDCDDTNIREDAFTLEDDTLYIHIVDTSETCTPISEYSVYKSFKDVYKNNIISVVDNYSKYSINVLNKINCLSLKITEGSYEFVNCSVKNTHEHNYHSVDKKIIDNIKKIISPYIDTNYDIEDNEKYSRKIVELAMRVYSTLLNRELKTKQMDFYSSNLSNLPYDSRDKCNKFSFVEEFDSKTPNFTSPLRCLCSHIAQIFMLNNTNYESGQNLLDRLNFGYRKQLKFEINSSKMRIIDDIKKKSFVRTDIYKHKNKNMVKIGKSVIKIYRLYDTENFGSIKLFLDPKQTNIMNSIRYI